MTEPSPRPRTARERARAEVRAELLAVARRHLATDGPANLSLRAVARDLGVASSAVYRYVDSRDALLTALIIEAYDAVGQVCEQALDAALDRGDDAGAAWLAVARAFRGWALENPHEFALVYGTPVPGYAAPVETVGSAVRLWGVVARVLVAARAGAALHPPRDLDATGLLEPAVLAFAAGIAGGATTGDAFTGAAADTGTTGTGTTGTGTTGTGTTGTGTTGTGTAAGTGGTPVDPAQLEADVARSITLFAALVGAVTAELFGHLHNLAHDLARVFDVTTATAAHGVGLDVPLDLQAAAGAGRSGGLAARRGGAAR